MDNKTLDNAVLDDQQLQEGLRSINPLWGEMAIQAAGKAWGLPHLDQKTKAFISIALDQMSLNVTGLGNPFGAHVSMARQQGATWEELEELIVFSCVYTGFNKGATTIAALEQLRKQEEGQE